MDTYEDYESILLSIVKVPKYQRCLELSVAFDNCRSKASPPRTDGKVAIVNLNHGPSVLVLLGESLMLVLLLVSSDVGLGEFL